MTKNVSVSLMHLPCWPVALKVKGILGDVSFYLEKYDPSGVYCLDTTSILPTLAETQIENTCSKTASVQSIFKPNQSTLGSLNGENDPAWEFKMHNCLRTGNDLRKSCILATQQNEKLYGSNGGNNSNRLQDHKAHLQIRTRFQKNKILWVQHDRQKRWFLDTDCDQFEKEVPFENVTRKTHCSMSLSKGRRTCSQIINPSMITSVYAQKVQGVSRGFFTYLKITGIGYRVFLVGDVLTFKLGFSHFVKVQVPASVKVFLPEPTFICFYGLDLNQVTQVAAKIQQIKPPSPYKGKGIRLFDRSIRLKTGKKKS